MKKGLINIKELIDLKELKIYDDWNEKRYYTREDKDNIFPIGIDDRKFVEIITNIFLGSDWYYADPISHNQINEVILEEILFKIKGKMPKERQK